MVWNWYRLITFMEVSDIELKENSRSLSADILSHTESNDTDTGLVVRCAN
jgi:hypothetical protein